MQGPADAGTRSVVHEVAHEVVRAADLRALRTEVVNWVRGTAEASGQPAEPALTERLEDVATAFYEALTNVVDHAYPEGAGPVHVTARLSVTGTPWLEIAVSDRGGWRPPPADPGHRGRGLLLLSGLTDGHDLQHEREGTRVRLWWHRSP
ncbi:anti-sigma regulatory factor (Ser/Thr protein kinase) [Actinomycetospora succinea]|uniref:Anti-sigma regulatory factor (Ser/Thr protein kinase) n=1 Tax=Actinomycetospora succinea TaxID=663603 RepID=A0A4R6VHH9_9PSEU|nr:ATP-binding protein [Actinomycetospora succinea]TDQ60776.1 anti-sigma regulatory factor (Ser/Thr protein kinase) [Actinomycetospora succinea]